MHNPHFISFRFYSCLSSFLIIIIRTGNLGIVENYFYGFKMLLMLLGWFICICNLDSRVVKELYTISRQPIERYQTSKSTRQPNHSANDYLLLLD